MKSLVLLFILLYFFMSPCAYSQDYANDSIVKSEFKSKVDLMVDSLDMSDSVKVEFFIIYHEYGATMKDAYENRAGWMQLYHTYKWALGERDEKMKEILNDDQFLYFSIRQKEIEREARQNRN